MSVPFHKISATGNDFVVIDHREQFLDEDQLSHFVREVCRYHTGVGGDGVLLLESEKNADFRMVYYNSDGSRAAMCGNGARAISWLARELKLWSDKGQFVADDGEHTVYHKNNRIGVSLNVDTAFRPVNLDDGEGWFINTGVPHVVLFSDDIRNENVMELGAKYRWDDQFQPEGANVNFVQVIDQRVNVRTFERGVENETLACGTGVMASSIITREIQSHELPHHITVPGGELEVNSENDIFMLWGGVDLVFKGDLILGGKITKYMT